jgi:hypothetical protein
MVAAVALISICGTSSASAAVEVGSDCMANDGEGSRHVVPLVKAPGSPMPLTAPFDGVVNPLDRAQRPRPDDQHANGAARGVSPNRRSQPGSTRRPERRGGRRRGGQLVRDEDLGASGRFLQRLQHRAGSGDALLQNRKLRRHNRLRGRTVAIGDVPIFIKAPERQVPVSVTLEPDADGDGYGDESQDGCPGRADHHGECPSVALRSSAVVKRRAILLTVTTSLEASVKVFGQVGWRLGPRPHQQGGTAKESAKRKTRLIVGLRGGTKELVAGQVTRFRIPLPRSVLRRLGRLAATRSLKAKSTASATDPEGRVTNTRLTVKLRGRERAG